MPCRPAVCSHSLGRAWLHSLPSKLDQASHYNLSIELFYEDLYYIAKTLPGGPTPQNHLSAAHYIRQLCDERNISIICLQPFMHYDGLIDRTRHAERIEEMKNWIQMAGILGTSLIGIPSTFLPEEEVSGDVELITRDLQEVADLGAPYGVQFAYEALSWGTHVDTWEASWEIVKRVDRDNFGLCLDTYNMAGRVYADPTSPTFKTPNAESEMTASLTRLINTVDVRKIAFVQVVDAEKLTSPLLPGHEFYDPTQCARMSWSRNCRLFYGEEDRGAYLPIKAILKAILVDLGFEGYLSAEMFNRSLVDGDSGVPERHARRVWQSWEKIVEDFGVGGDGTAAAAATAAATPAVVRSGSVGRLEIEPQAPRAQL
ncbi:related to dehydroshikimate dehydratase [Ramularia collo-cygni]|uniref:Related to dehydroshikimate dehydratase n=1 Tax=Ramularia collo-cygni TaxID=112498 RepID=A0A2D3UQE1_9PEZI|nr:related to dehydroshikimate dehydratase [Ramularia collo-cygni]CZT16458.1 related to dehydroshikimate dehydratase [Ramularia collo-cygni]